MRVDGEKERMIREICIPVMGPFYAELLLVLYLLYCNLRVDG